MHQGTKWIVMICAILLGAGLGAGASVAQSGDVADRAGGPLYRIRPFGDSITAGYGFGVGCPFQPPQKQPVSCWPPNQDGGGYRAFLVGSPPNKAPSMMVGGRHDNSAMWLWQFGQQSHDGYSGFTINQLQPIAKSSTTSDVILVHAGTNDVRAAAKENQGCDPVTCKTDEEMGKAIADDLTVLLVNLLMTDRNAKVLVAQIVPNFEDNGAEGIVRDYNSRIPSVVAQFAQWGRVVKMVDMHSGMDRSDFVDNVHPNFAGYEKMANRWRAEINSLSAVALPAIPGEGRATK